jgi:hypothetical protein
LEWEESVKGRWIGTAPVKLGNLAFWIFQSENGYLRHIAGQGAVTYPTLEAAKAAAQADYERRILAALDTPAPALMDELVEAQQGVTDLIALLNKLGDDMDKHATHDWDESELIWKTAATLTALSAETVALKAKIAEYEAHDGMHGAIVHAIRSLLNEGNVPGAAFIDDHVANAIVQRDALAAQVAELARERDALADGKDGWKSSSDEYERLFRNAEAKVARLEEALRPFCFFSEDDPEQTTQDAWEMRYRSRFEDWIDFGDIENARAALTEGDTNDRLHAPRIPQAIPDPDGAA